MLVDAGAGGSSNSSGSSDPNSRGRVAGGSRSSSSSATGGRHVRFNDEAASGTREPPQQPGFNDVSSIRGEGTMVLSRVRPGALRVSAQHGAAGRTIDERGIENLGAPSGGWDKDIKKVKGSQTRALQKDAKQKPVMSKSDEKKSASRPSNKPPSLRKNPAPEVATRKANLVRLLPLSTCLWSAGSWLLD